ncbi:MAG: extracellular solute-binding protein [Chloroflexi bacterium]|nr:extracellular solute-binding protein [Chloroflexota bacterium]
MKKLFCLVTAFVLAGLLAVACGPAPGSSSPAAQKPPAAGVPEAPSKPGWERAWESTLAEARKEGKLTIYETLGPGPRVALSEAFMKKFGIEAEFASFSKALEVMAKVNAENRAGLYLADLFFIGTSTNIAVFKPAGLLGPMDSLLVLPEVTDANAWSGGKFPFVDREKTVIAITVGIKRDVIFNSDLVKRGELTSYRDLLKPQYKGKIILNDPTIAGGGGTFIAFLANKVWNPQEAAEFLTQLIRQQDVVIQRDLRQLVESVARGKFAIGLGPHTGTFVEFVRLGAPVDAATMKEGTYSIAGSGAFSVPARFAHPNAARVFVNWLLTKEGQTVFAQSYGNPSARLDVSTEGIHPLFLRQPGETVFFDDEGFILFREKALTFAKEIVDNAMKK